MNHECEIQSNHKGENVIKRKLLAVVLLGVMATAVLTGCGAEKEETTVAEVETDAEVVVDEDEDVSTPADLEEDV